MRTLLLLVLWLVLALTAAQAQAESEGYDSPVHSDAATDQERKTTAQLPAELHRPAEIPWAYEYSRRVYDYARVLSPVALQHLNNALLSTTLTLVTVPYRDGEPLAEYAERVRNQFSQAIPPFCERTPPTVPSSWENTCFVQMQPHNAQRESVLVYDPNGRDSSLAIGSVQLPPGIVARLIKELKGTPYHRQTALANYRAEPPRIGLLAPWRRLARVVDPPAVRYVPAISSSSVRYLVSMLLMSTILATVYGLVRLYRHHANVKAPRLALKRRSFAPAFMPAPKNRRYYERPSPY
jgi:hypothetical protein